MMTHPQDLALAARKHPMVIANATTARLAPRIARLKGITAATMNQMEAGALDQESRRQDGRGNGDQAVHKDPRRNQRGPRPDHLPTAHRAGAEVRDPGSPRDRLHRGRRRPHGRPGLGHRPPGGHPVQHGPLPGPAAALQRRGIPGTHTGTYRQLSWRQQSAKPPQTHPPHRQEVRDAEPDTTQRSQRSKAPDSHMPAWPGAGSA